MSDSDFTHDVFLSHSSKDKAVVRVVAERLRADGVRAWFDVSDHGIDMEIEFRNDAGEAAGEMLFLQLKSGNARSLRLT